MRSELTGRFGRLAVVERAGRKGKHARYRCRCDCGREVVVYATNLRRGRTSSCGCLQRELAKVRFTTHGGSHRRHPLYGVWVGMHKRCRYPGDKRYADYGGRGITVCDRWSGRDGFAQFVADMGPRPDGCLLDREDNDGRYEPGNCRWVTLSESNRNRRPFRLKGRAES